MSIIILFFPPLDAAGMNWGAFFDGFNRSMETYRQLEEIQLMQEQRRMLEQQRQMMEQEQQRIIEQQKAIRDQEQRHIEQQRLLREEEQRRLETQRQISEQEQRRIEQQGQTMEQERKRTSEAGKLTAGDWFNKTRTLFKDGKLTDPERAIEYLSEAIRQNPDFAEAYGGRGSAYAELKQYQRAIQDFDTIIRLKPNDARGYYNRGTTYGKYGQYQRAIQDFDTAIRLKPDHALAYNNRGIAYFFSGNKPEGCSSFIRACELGSCKGYESAKQKGHCQSPEKNVLGSASTSPPTQETAKDARFIVSENGTVLDTKTKLMWAAKDNGININWENAKSYCENYRGGGYSDWRMPTQYDLATLHNAAKKYASTCGYDAYLHESISLSCILLWAINTRGSEAAFFNFAFGIQGWDIQSTSRFQRALPVRSAR